MMNGYGSFRTYLLISALLGVSTLSVWYLSVQPSFPVGIIHPTLTLGDFPDGPQRWQKNIFFVETTCAVDENASHLQLTPRQACAVESAVKYNEKAHIYVLHTCPKLEPVTGAHFHHISLLSFLGGTPVENLVTSGALAQSQYPKEHASDVLRYTALWKYGGIYLDMDIVVTKNLDPLGENWAGAESNDVIGSCALAMSASEGSPGFKVAEASVIELKDNFNGDSWGHNGPGLITRVLQKFCYKDKVSDMHNCSGFYVLPASQLFPIPYRLWRQYFDPAAANQTLQLLKEAYTVHVWNKLSSEEQFADPHSAYATLAQSHCPMTYKQYNKAF